MRNKINTRCLIFQKILRQISNELTDIENLGILEAKKHLSKDVQFRFRGLIMRNPISLQFPKKTRLNWNLLTRMIEFLKILKDIIWLLQVWRKLRSLEHFVYRPIFMTSVELMRIQKKNWNPRFQCICCYTYTTIYVIKISISGKVRIAFFMFMNFW